MTPSGACEGNSSYWDQYYYWPTGRNGERMGHNLHHESLLREEVRALFQLYGVQVMGVVSGKVHVMKTYEVASPILHSLRRKPIYAANDGPIDAPIEYWQAVCKTLLDYAVEHGYKEPLYEQEIKHSER